jgi:Uma2 family endonuclease
MGSITETDVPTSLPARWRISVDDFHRMAEAGIFGPDDRVELVDGELIAMAPIGTKHAACVAQLARLFWSRSGDRAVIWPQNPLLLAEDMELYPDLVLLRPREDGYTAAVPRPQDALLVIEVSDTTLRYDRGEKLRHYAEAGIAEYWIFDVAGRQTFVFRDPAEGGYRIAETPELDDPIAPVLLPDARLTPREAMG